jgi:hypothetical protein
MATSIGIHTLILKGGISAQDFEALFEEQFLPVAADTPGSVNRGGRSTIASQHLLKPAGGAADYIWMVKSSGVFPPDSFETVLQRMYDEAIPSLDAMCEKRSTVVYTQATSYDAGPRDALGRPTGPPVLNLEL